MSILWLLICMQYFNIVFSTSSVSEILANEMNTIEIESKDERQSEENGEIRKSRRSMTLRGGHPKTLHKESFEKKKGIDSLQSIEHLNEHADISSLECGEIIEQISPTDATSRFIEILNDTFLPGSVAHNYFLALGTSMINYGVEVRKVCASCKTLLSENTNQLLKNKAFKDFCGDNVYGNDALHSGLLLIPLVEGGQDSKKLIKKPGLSAGFIFSRSSLENPDARPPSESWGVGKNFGKQNISTFLAATAGYVTIAPDFMGYGESSKQSLHKSHFLKKTYLTSTVPLWLQTGIIIERETSCNSFLANASVFGGYDEGGYASLVLADGMNKALNLNVMKIEAGGTVYDIASSLEHIVHGMSENNFSSEAKSWLSMLTSTYSISNPSVPSYHSAQLPASEKSLSERGKTYRSNVNITDDRIPEKTLLIEDSLAMLNPDIVKEILNTSDGTPKFCSLKNNTLNEHICDMLTQNSLMDVLRDASYKIRLCHSTSDSPFSFDDLPPFDINSRYVDFLIQPRLDHIDDSEMCSLSLVSFLNSPEAKSFSLERKSKECAYHSQKAIPSTATSSSSTSTTMSSYTCIFLFMAFLAVVPVCLI